VRIHKHELGVQIWIRECGAKGKLGEAKPRTMTDGRWVGATGVVMKKSFDTDKTRKITYKNGDQVAYVKKKKVNGKWTDEEIKAKVIKVTPAPNFKDVRYGIKYIHAEKKDFTKLMDVPVSKIRPHFPDSWWVQLDTTPLEADSKHRITEESWIYIPERLLQLNRQKKVKRRKSVIEVQDEEKKFWLRLNNTTKVYLGCLCVLLFCALYFGF